MLRNRCGDVEGLLLNEGEKRDGVSEKRVAKHDLFLPVLYQNVAERNRKHALPGRRNMHTKTGPISAASDTKTAEVIHPSSCPSPPCLALSGQTIVSPS